MQRVFEMICNKHWWAAEMMLSQFGCFFSGSFIVWCFECSERLFRRLSGEHLKTWAGHTPITANNTHPIEWHILYVYIYISGQDTTVIPLMIRHSSSLSFSVNRRDTISSGFMRNRISSCTRPEPSTPPPIKLQAKSTCTHRRSETECELSRRRNHLQTFWPGYWDHTFMQKCERSHNTICTVRTHSWD